MGKGFGGVEGMIRIQFGDFCFGGLWRIIGSRRSH